jgi:hypothetical protein
MEDRFAEQLGTLTVSQKSIRIARDDGVLLTNQRNPDVFMKVTCPLISRIMAF